MRDNNKTNLEKEGHMRQARYRFFLLPLLFVLACAGAFAQANSEVTGTITDQTGAVVAGANVTLTDPATGTTHATVSSSSGLYDFAGLNPANYNLRITAKGFENFVQTGIVVNVSATFTVNVKLTLGADTQTVSVVADSLTVQADSNVISTLITGQEITSIATANRNFAALVALGLGVSSQLPDQNNLGAFGANWNVQFNGLREAHNIWLIDGGEAADRGAGGGMEILPSQEAIAEFNMMSSNYPPDTGMTTGATISISLKSGTRAFHGSAWEENRATAYDANSWSNKKSGQPRAATHYNIYGFSVGGPIYIPHVYNTNKNKGFFFFSQEWRKTSSVATGTEDTIPTADRPVSGKNLTYVDPTYAPAHDKGTTWLTVPNVKATSDYAVNHLGGLTPGGCFDGSAKIADSAATLAAQKANPTAAAVYNCTAGQTIPSGLFDPNGVLYLTGAALPTANVPGSDAANASAALPQKVDDTVIRGDYNINDKWAILVHYIGDHQNQSYGQPELSWCGCDYKTLGSQLSSPAHAATFKLTGSIKPNLLLEASMNYDGNGADIMPSENTYLPAAWSVSPVVSAYVVQRKLWPNMDFGTTLPENSGRGMKEETATEPYHNAAQDFFPKVDVSYTTGKHQLKFGFSYNRYTKNQMMYSAVQGQYNWGQLSGNTLMDVLLGLPAEYSQAQSAGMRHYYSQSTSAYVQDNWHVTPRLSVQLGLRYDAMPHTVERQNLLGNFDQATYQTGTAAAPIWTSTGTIDPKSPSLYTYNGIPAYINGTRLAGQNGNPRGVVINDYKTLQPRLGFSEDLFGNGKTVIRGGMGIFYEHFQGNDAYNISTSAPFNPSLDLFNPYFSTPGKNYVTGNSVAANSLIFAGGGVSSAQDFRAPAAAMYSLGVQHELTPSVIWVVQYVGNLQWHQNVINGSLNGLPTNIGTVSLAAGQPASCTVGVGGATSANCVDARQVAGDGGGKYGSDAATSFGNYGGENGYRQYPGYGAITQDENTLTGNYNGLQSAVRIQNRWGLSGEVDYTYSHIIDVQSQDRNTIDNPWNLKYDKGSGSYDRRHIFQANYVYNLPFFNKSQGLIKSLAGGWQIAGTFIKETGMPQQVNLSASYDPVGLGGGYQNHPNITAGGKLKYPKKVNQWFDASRIDNGVKPVWDGGTNLGFGNWGKDTLVLPGRFNLTTSLYKTFQIYRDVSFQMKFESFNTLNHTEFNSYDTGSGAVNGTQDPRELQLGGKFTF
jgi:hypothetical protein